MKKIMALLLVVLLSVSLFACNGEREDDVETVVAQVETTQESTTEAETTAASTTQAPTEKETEAATEKPIQARRSNGQILESGIWVVYSPQDVVFDVYKFNHGVGEYTSYLYDNGQVTLRGGCDGTVSYEIDGDEVHIFDSDSSYIPVWKFSDNQNYLTYSWQSYLGPEDGPIVTQKVYHRYELPSYEEAVKEKEDMWV